MRRTILVATACLILSSSLSLARAHAAESESLDIQRYQHRGCVLADNEHYPPDYAHVGINDTYWYGTSSEYRDFEFKNCRGVISQAQDSCDLAVTYPGYLPLAERQTCNAQYQAEVPECRSHYEDLFEACEIIKSSAADRPQPGHDTERRSAATNEPVWEELLPSDALAPGWEELEPDDPYDPSALDRELFRQEAALQPRHDRQGAMDAALDRLAAQLQAVRRNNGLDSPPQVSVDVEEQLREFEAEYQRLVEEHNRLQAPDGGAGVPPQSESGEGLATFLQILGKGAELYNMYHQLSVPHESFSGGSGPQHFDYEQQPQFTPLACVLADGSPGLSDGQGGCYRDDTSRAR